MTTLVCIDDNQLVGEAMERRFTMEPDFEWLGWLNEPEGILDQLTKLRPELVLLDVDVPGLDSFELVSSIAQKLPSMRVVMFSGYLRPEFQERALASGAWGFISKGATPKDVVHALRRVAAGHVVGDDED